MPSYSLTYSFSQSFPFSAKEVYDWCVDYRADDWKRMGKKGTRKVRRIDGSTLILEDTVITQGKPVTKHRLVKLYPGLLMWTNTRVSSAGRHSQFIYRIIPEGQDSSRLEFTGAQVEESRKKLTPAKVAELSEQTRIEDSALWVRLADEMKRDLGSRA